MLLGQKLKKLREDRNLMQRQIGALIEIDGALISKIENGDKPINRKHLKKLSIHFKVPLQELETLWLADKIERTIQKEKLGKEALKVCYINLIGND